MPSIEFASKGMTCSACAVNDTRLLKQNDLPPPISFQVDARIPNGIGELLAIQYTLA
jgi:hypothetical protein